MSVSYSRDQVLALAPDASSVKAAQKLLNPGKWPVLQHDDDAVWGECKGSGKKPYLVQVDRSEPAFKCSCPSRKFPCKHGLALMLLLADLPADFSAAEAPPRVKDWLETRRGRAEKKAERAATKAAKPVDLEAIKKRDERRRREIEDGLQDFELWLQDLIRQGAASLPGQDRSFWEKPAARLVDAKAPGMARFIHQARGLVGRQGDWTTEVLAVLGRAHLLRRAFAGLESLPEVRRADIRAAVGWPLDQDLVRAQDTTPTEWRILGLSMTESDRLRQQRIWLQDSTGRHALLLSFAHGRRPFDIMLSPGHRRMLDLAFFPSACPLRAALKPMPDGDAPSAPVDEFHGTELLSEALDQTAGALALNPWLDRLPWSLKSMHLAFSGSSLRVIDREGRAYPIHGLFTAAWELVAVAGGRPIDIFGEWRVEGFMPLGCLGQDGYVTFACEEIQ